MELEPIDISDEVSRFCSRLGLEIRDVAEINIKPDNVSVLIYKRDEHGRVCLDGNDPVMRRFVRLVQT